MLVITHLPQVAAQAAQHLQVSKTQANGATLSHIQNLSEAQRIEEIARMLGRFGGHGRHAQPRAGDVRVSTLTTHESRLTPHVVCQMKLNFCKT